MGKQDRVEQLTLKDLLQEMTKDQVVQLTYENLNGDKIKVIGSIRYAPLPEWTEVTTELASFQVLAGLGNSNRGEVWRTPHETKNDPTVPNFGREVVGKFKSAKLVE